MVESLFSNLSLLGLLISSLSEKVRQFGFLVSKELVRLCDKCWLVNKCAIGFFLVQQDEAEMATSISCSSVLCAAYHVTGSETLVFIR